MTYMKIAKKSDRILHLSREPGIRAWSMFVGVISIGIGAVYFSLDNIVWTSVCILGSFIIAMSCLDDWEECIFNKGTKEVRMKTFNLMQKLVLPAGKQRQVVANLSDIIAVRVQEEDIKYAGKGHYVVLVFGTGFVIPIAERCTIGDKNEHEALCREIKLFLNLNEKMTTDDLGYEDDISSSDSDYDTERNGTIEHVAETNH